MLNQKNRNLNIKIAEIKGMCPVYQQGQSFYLKDGYILDVQRSDNVCLHSLASIMPYYAALSKGIRPINLGLARNADSHIAYVQCLDPCQYTGGGTVIFQIEIME